MRYIVFALLFLCASATARNIQLKENLSGAKPGCYLVLEQNKTFTFFHIHDRFQNYIVIEEVSIPASCFLKNPMNWKTWFEKGAPGHTSWIMSQVNLNTGLFEETFSFTHQGWIDMSDSNSFLTTLLNLHFKEVPLAERRKIGLPPGYNKQDTRPIWNPRLVVNGHIVSNVPFFAFKARWPSDGSELARKKIEIYLPAAAMENRGDEWYPGYFPYWLEVEGKIGCAKARVVDSGMEALSPRQSLPRRAPKLLGEAQINSEGIQLYLTAPSSYKEFVVMAENGTSFFGTLFPLPCHTSGEKGALKLFIAQEHLENIPSEGNLHLFISPKEDPSVVLQTCVSLKQSFL